MFQPGQVVRVNLAGLQAEGVMFQAAVTDAVGHIVKQTSEQPPKYFVKLLFSFRGVSEVEVLADRTATSDTQDFKEWEAGRATGPIVVLFATATSPLRLF